MKMKEKTIKIYSFIVTWKKGTPEKVRLKMMTNILKNKYVKDISGSISITI